MPSAPNITCSATAYATWIETLIDALVEIKGNLGVLFNNLRTKLPAPNPDITNWDTVQSYRLQEVANNLESVRASIAGEAATPPFPE